MALKIFAGRSNEPLARAIVDYIGDLSSTRHLDIQRSLSDPLRLGVIGIKDHADGEVHVHFGESIRGDDVFLIQSTNQPERNFAELKQMVLAAKQSQAWSISVVMPYFGYARQDRRDRPRAAVEAVGRAKDLVGRGANRFLLLDPHSNAIEAGLAWEPIAVDRLWAKSVFVSFLKSHHSLFDFDPDNLVVASPDLGSFTLANIYAELLESRAEQIPVVAVVKRRKPGESETDILRIVGEEEIKDRQDATVLIVDDMIDGGSTICKAASVLKNLGAGRIYAISTHGVFSGKALQRIGESPIDRVFITDSICWEKLPSKVEVVSVAPLLGEAIFRIHTNKSVSSLFGEVR